MTLRKRLVGIAVVVVVVIAAVGIAVKAFASGGSGDYRTALATRADVTQSLSLTGTIAPDGRSDLAFASSGTVNAVDVTLGQTVAAGAVIATLDSTSLQAAMTKAQAEVAQAKAQLSKDTTALAAQQAAAAAAAASAAAQPAQQPSQSPSDALKKALQDAQTDCVTTVDAALCSADITAADTAAQQLQAATTASATRQNASGGTQGGSATVSAATIAKDQAGIDQALVTQAKAQLALDGATVKAPAAGKVVALSLTVGSDTTSGSTVATVVAPGLTTVTLSTTATQAKLLAVGQPAQVTPTGSTKAYTAKVTRVSTIPTSSDSTTYPVVVTLDQENLGLLTGISAAVDVTVGTATGVVTVPTSAVVDGFVREVAPDGTLSRVRVTTGVVGAARTEIKSGLSVGAKVVLADLSEALPTSGTTTTENRFGGTGAGGFAVTGGTFGGGAGGFARQGG